VTMARQVQSVAGMRAVVVLLLAAACTPPPTRTICGTRRGAASENRLTVNSLSSDRLSVDGLASSALTADDICSGDEELTRYLALCALPAGDTLTAPDGTVYPGRLGLAPSWKFGPLDPNGMHFISACLMAHVNFFGTAVPISIRGPFLTTTDDERAQFSAIEASFYGDVFSDPKVLFSCHAASNLTNDELNKRICATTDGCGFKINSCPDVCMHESGAPDHYHMDCWADGVLYGQVLTTYLEPAVFGSTDGYGHL
jgi:hypothetical protein